MCAQREAQTCEAVAVRSREAHARQAVAWCARGRLRPQRPMAGWWAVKLGWRVGASLVRRCAAMQVGPRQGVCVSPPSLPCVRQAPGVGERVNAGARALSLTFHGCVRPLRSACPLDGPACRRTRRCAWRRAHLCNARHSATRLANGVTSPQPTARHRMRARPCAESRSGKHHVNYPACSPTMRHTNGSIHPNALTLPYPLLPPPVPRRTSARKAPARADGKRTSCPA